MLADAGHRASAPREEVIEAIASLGCSVTAREVSDLLRERGSGVGLASIYRALELLERLGLIKRFDVGEGVARYEPAHPSGEHHHHVVCDSCGKVEPFEDDGAGAGDPPPLRQGELRGRRARRDAARRVPGLPGLRLDAQPAGDLAAAEALRRSPRCSTAIDST